MARRDPPPGIHVTYNQQYRRCHRSACPSCRQGAPGHGPYWYAYWREDGRLHSAYIGLRRPDAALSAASNTPQEPVAVPVLIDDHPVLPIRVSTLGRFIVWRDGVALPSAAWHRRKVDALFKHLLSAPHQRLHRDYLLDQLWPEEDPHVAASKLRLTVHRLRRTLGESNPVTSIVRMEGETLALIPAVLTSPDQQAGPWIDAVAFEQAATTALDSSDIATCQAAVALYTGDYLPDDPYDEQATERREELRRLFFTLLMHLSGLQITAGRYDDGLRCLRIILSAEPSHEAAVRAMMTAQAAAGHTRAALLTYRRLVETLRHDFELDPDTETQDLYVRLLTSRTTTSQRTNLPTLLTHLIGRDDELKALAARIDPLANDTYPYPTNDAHGTNTTYGNGDGATIACRLLTLTGTGGSGKTCLAITLGLAIVEQFHDGVWLVELAALTDHALIEGEVARVLGVRSQSKQTLREALIASLRNRQLLLLLDNCEHHQAACASLAATLLHSCPSLTIVATSRTALGVAGEMVWRVNPLTVANPVHLPPIDELSTYAAVRLFVERARAVQPTFTLTARNCTAVAAICARLDGLPLALELAAAWMTVMSPQSLLARLNGPVNGTLDMLVHRSYDLPARHRMLRDTIAWSCRLLSPETQRVFQRLAVFARNWTLDAAATICLDRLPDQSRDATIELMHHLGVLVNASLVQYDEDVAGDRYTMLETIRSYATEQMQSSNDAARLHTAHLEYFLSQAEEAATHESDAAWVRRLDSDLDNLRAALRWSLDSGLIESGLRLAIALRFYWYWHGYFQEGRLWIDRLLAEVSRLEKTSAERAALDITTPRLLSLRGQAVGAASMLAYRQNDLAAATTLLAESLEIARQIDDRARMSSLINSLGLLHKEQGQYEKALELFREGMALDQEMGDNRGVAVSLSNQGWVAHAQGDYERAMHLYAQSMCLAQENGYTLLIASIRGNQAHAAVAQGHLAEATCLYQEVLTSARDMAIPWGCAVCLEGLARVAVQRGDPRRALRWCGAADAIRVAINAPMTAEDRRAYGHDQALALARTALRSQDAEAAWSAGAALTLEEACAEALAFSAHPARPQHSADLPHSAGAPLPGTIPVGTGAEGEP